MDSDDAVQHKQALIISDAPVAAQKPQQQQQQQQQQQPACYALLNMQHQQQQQLRPFPKIATLSARRAAIQLSHLPTPVQAWQLHSNTVCCSHLQAHLFRHCSSRCP
jgi:hypothetical protein